MSESKRGDALSFEIEFYEGILKNSPNHLEALLLIAEAYTRAGLFEKGLSADRRLAELCPDDPNVFYNLACSCALLNHKEEALRTLEKAIQLGYSDFKHLRNDKDLAGLHGEPGFEAILKKNS